MEKIQILRKAQNILEGGGIVGIPTETVYGLAASIESDSGLRLIFSTKERPFFDPLIVHIADMEQVSTVVREWPELAAYLAKVFWPGPLTIVLPKALTINPLITAGLDTVGVRMPRHELTRELIRMLSSPVAAPSANKFGKTSPTSAAHVSKNFPEIFVLDGGAAHVGLESTVIAIKTEGDLSEVAILRPGGITKTMLEDALRDWSGKSRLVTRENDTASPGHTLQHYMPEKPLVIIDEKKFTAGKSQKLIEDALSISNAKGAELVLDDDPVIAARLLYKQLHEYSAKRDAHYMYVVKKPAMRNSLWDAIWDRLQRAATSVIE